MGVNIFNIVFSDLAYEDALSLADAVEGSLVFLIGTSFSCALVDGADSQGLTIDSTNRSKEDTILSSKFAFDRLGFGRQSKKRLISLISA